MLRSLIPGTCGVFIFAALASGCSAQTVTMKTSPDSADVTWPQLAFSHNGRVLRENASLNSDNNSGPVRIAAYDTVTGAVIRERTLALYTRVESQTSDGRTLLISQADAAGNAPAKLFLLDADTGVTQPIPREWFDADDERPTAALSGDGRLVSAYSENGPQESPMVVTLYDWKTKKPVAKQMQGFPAGGAASGGVTVDGKIEFDYSRSGSEIVDPQTGRVLMHEGVDSVRSPDGAWVVDFPYEPVTDPGVDVKITHGEDGRPAGKLDLPLTEDQRERVWPGTFCGTSGSFVTAVDDTVYVFQIPTGMKLASFAPATWRDAKAPADSSVSIACTDDGKRIAIRSGTRLTVQDVKN